MIRVGFVMNDAGHSWLGGVNYYRNLFGSLANSQKIEPVIFAGGGRVPQWIVDNHPNYQVVQSPFVHPATVAYNARKIVGRLIDHDIVMDRILRRHQVDVLSHANDMGRRAKLPTLCWIPDFQHMRMPEFFEEGERAWRDRSYARMADACTRVIVSSEVARQDLAAFRPSAASKARVLRFVAAVGDFCEHPEPRDKLMQRFGLGGPYFHLPNQFWKHKNHAVVVEALALARSRGTPMCVVATGNPGDRRNPEHFAKLMERVRETGCEADFRLLGVVPYSDLAALIRHSIALINPSLFEGWSTTVEEAKSLGKTILLSDIPVHREQSPEFGIFFDPQAPEELLQRMRELDAMHSPALDEKRLQRARAELPVRMAAFAQTFERIVTEAVSAP